MLSVYGSLLINEYRLIFSLAFSKKMPQCCQSCVVGGGGSVVISVQKL